MPCVKNSTFTEYKFAFLLLHSAKTQFLKAKQELNVESDRSE